MIWLSLLFIGLALCANLYAETYKLSERTNQQLKLLNTHISDANQRLILANALIAISPFQVLLGKPEPGSILQITLTNWTELGQASLGLNSHFRSELKKFCQLEALKQHNSPDDRKFWIEMSKSFSYKKSKPRYSAVGDWRGTCRYKNNTTWPYTFTLISVGEYKYKGNIKHKYGDENQYGFINFPITQGHSDKSNNLSFSDETGSFIFEGKIVSNGKRIEGFQYEERVPCSVERN